MFTQINSRRTAAKSGGFFRPKGVERGLFILLLFFLLPNLFCAEEGTDDQVRYVLTRLGLIQEGIPEDRGETLFLRLPNSSGGLTISKLDILFVGFSRHDIFEYQKKQLPAGDVGSLLKFADWAGRNRLAPEAIALLKTTAESTADPSSRAAILEKLAKMEYVERIKNEAVRRVQDSAPPSASDTAAAEPADPERERLNAFAKQIPFSVEERFSRKIEPVLLRRCAAAECHQGESGNGTFSLSEPSTAQSYRMGHLRNLETVLDAVSFQRPETSPILNHPPVSGPNGERIWPFGEDADSLKDYELFVAWVTSLGSKMKNYTPDPNRPHPVYQTIQAGGAAGQSPLSADFNAVSDPNSPLSANIESEETGSGRKADINSDAEALRRAGYLPTETLRDEFDPAPFNRKYHPDRTAGGLSKKTNTLE